MAFLLDEDDEFDTLEATLSFLEECTDVALSPICYWEHDRAEETRTELTIPEQLIDEHHTNNEETHLRDNGNEHLLSKRKKPRISDNRNRARDERRQEILFLQGKVQMLEHQLSQLQTSHCCRESAMSLTTAKSLGNTRLIETTRSRGEKSQNVWRELAVRQYEQRTQAERENIRLKLRLRDQLKVAKSLEKILTGRSAMRELKACGLGTSSALIHSIPADHSDATIYMALLTGLEDSYSEVNSVFAAIKQGRGEITHSDGAHMSGGTNGSYLEVFPDKVLPFEMQGVGTAIWQHFVYRMDRVPYRFYYQKDPKDTAEDTIVDKLGVELHVNKTKANFSIKQIFRRHIELNRIVILWHAVLELVAFADEPISGVFFHEKGYILIHRPDSAVDTLVQTCYLTTPEITNPMIKDNHERTQLLTDFVLRSTTESITISHQIIENGLLDQSLRQEEIAVR